MSWNDWVYTFNKFVGLIIIMTYFMKKKEHHAIIGHEFRALS